MLSKQSALDDDHIPLTRHDSIIGALPPRPWNRSSSYLAHEWNVYTQESDLLDEKPVKINFDVPMTPWPNVRRLTDPTLEKDLITAKLYVFNCLEPKPLGWGGAGTALADWQRLLTFLRWRIDRGISSNSLLTEEWHREYANCVKSQGYGGLIRGVERVEELLKAVRSGKIDLPRVKHGTSYRVRVNKVAQLLGLSNTCQIPREAHVLLDSYINEQGLKRVSNKSADEPKSAQDKFEIREHTAFSMLMPWFRQWQLREKLSHDPINVQVYRSPREIRRYIKKWTGPREVTPDIPPYQAAFLINASLSLVLSCGEIVGDIYQALLKYGSDNKACPNLESGEFAHVLENLKNQLSPIGRIVPKYVTRGRNSKNRSKNKLDADVRTLLLEIFPAACAVIISAFSARREKETMSLMRQCIEIDERGDCWLRCLIAKNLKSYEQIPVPASVRVAVEALRRIGAASERGEERSRLFRFKCPVYGRSIQFRLNDAIRTLATWTQVPPLPDGRHWHFTSRQFRKLFSITYFWRYHYPSLTALSHHLRHFNPNTTRGYIKFASNRAAMKIRDEQEAESRRRSAERQQWLSDIDRENDFAAGARSFVSQVIHDAAAGRAPLGGRGGQEIMAQMEALRSLAYEAIDVASSENEEDSFNRVLSDLIDNTTLTPHPEGHGLCKCGSSIGDLASARCLIAKQNDVGQRATDASGPDHSYAEDTVCAVCLHNIQLEIFDRYWRAEEDTAKAALNTQSGPACKNTEQRLESIVSLRRSQPWSEQ